MAARGARWSAAQRHGARGDRQIGLRRLGLDAVTGLYYGRHDRYGPYYRMLPPGKRQCQPAISYQDLPYGNIPVIVQNFLGGQQPALAPRDGPMTAMAAGDRCVSTRQVVSAIE